MIAWLLLLCGVGVMGMRNLAWLPTNFFAYYDMQIVRRETISVPAGSFDTFLIEGNGWNTTTNQKLEARLWLVPGVNFAIRREFVVRNQRGAFRQTERHELVALRQQTRGAL